MIPTQLTLQNFLSYREIQTIDFTGVNLAVISGKNGHGKSALLDAITWVLWGEARKSSGKRKPDDDLLNRQIELEDGDSKMQVDLDFTSGEQSYRVRRSYRKTASGKSTESDLQFWSLNQLGEPNQTYTAGSQRETQEIINEHVGMDYELFAATSLFEQGEWDDMLQSTPAERKDLLFELLQLDRFDDLHNQARKKKNGLDAAVKSAEKQIESLKEELEDADERADTLENKRAELGSIEEELETQRALHERRKKLETDIKEAKQQHDHLQEMQSKLASEIEDLEGQIQAKENKLTSAQSDLNENEPDKLKKVVQSKDRIKSQIKKQEEARERHQKLKNKLQKVRNDISSAEQMRDRYIENAQEEIDEFYSDDPVKQIDDLQSSIEEKETRAENLEDAVEAAEILENDVEDIKQEIQDAEKDIEWIDRQIESEEEFIENATGAESHCPRCGTEMTAEHVDTIVSESEESIDTLKQDRQVIEDELDDLNSELEETERRLENAKEDVDLREDILDEVEEMQREVNDLQNEVGRMEEKVDDLQKVRENDLSPIGLTEDLGDLYDREEKLNEELMDVPYNEGRLKDLNDQLQRVYEAESKLERVKGLEDKVSSLKEDVASKKETLSDKENEANTLSGKIDNQSSKISEMDKELSQLDGGTEEDVEELRLKVRELKGKIDKLEVKVEADKNTREEIDQLKQTREQKAERQETASLLSEAFGRHGIPSMVLEGALPQIEERANEFLSDLTSGKMKVRMDTTREKKTGGTADTLDITVLVGGTEQPYEMFSGGESFRINFAIRVALSQHLAAKTGRPIRTLMIDEGFGTQDGEGKDKVKDTIAYASKHFDRVLVITHIKQLKDAFPQRVEVTKAPGRGSVVDVIR